MKELLEYLARGLVDQPDQVRVNELHEDDGATVLELSVADDDYGNVIGRGGRTAYPAAARTGSFRLAGLCRLREAGGFFRRHPCS